METSLFSMLILNLSWQQARSFLKASRFRLQQHILTNRVFAPARLDGTPVHNFKLLAHGQFTYPTHTHLHTLRPNTHSDPDLP